MRGAQAFLLGRKRHCERDAAARMLIDHFFQGYLRRPLFLPLAGPPGAKTASLFRGPTSAHAPGEALVIWHALTAAVLRLLLSLGETSSCKKHCGGRNERGSFQNFHSQYSFD